MSSEAVLLSMTGTNPPGEEEASVELWDQTIEDESDALSLIGADGRFDVAIEVIRSTLGLFDPPFSEFFPSAHLALIDMVVERYAKPGARLGDKAGFSREFLAKYDELPVVAVRPAVGPFLMAIVRLCEIADSPMSVDDTLEILSSCYESILMSQLSGRVTLEDEERNPLCMESIRLQREIISGHARG